MVLTSSSPEDTGTSAGMAKVPVASPTSHTTPLPRSRLHVWVVGNPISGGKQGAMKLNRIETLFRQSFGEDTVQTTSSSTFLHNLSLHQPLSGVATSPSPIMYTPWDSAAAAVPARPAGCSQSPVASCASGVVVSTLIIRTDHEGHSKAVSRALSQLILSSRLEQDRQRSWQGQRSPSAQHGVSAATAAEYARGAEASPLPRHRRTFAINTHASIIPAQPSTHHILLVVGGDGTLSEVTNGLCEGTLAGFAQLTPSGSSLADAASTTSHAHVEREAAVLSHLLPAILYVPGGTGSDFAKLGLCCHTAEDALHVVRDGLVHQLFSAASRSYGEDGSHRDCEACRDVPLGSPAAPQDASAQPALSACAAHAVDVGRIEFLRTGTRHFFINECSAGMSCDVIRRGERFKRCRWISILGGLLLFATSAFVSLLLMKPTPLYICKLPPRVPLSAASAALVEDYDTDSGVTETDASQEQMRLEGNGSGESNGGAAELYNSSQCRKPTSAGSRSDAVSASPLGSPNSLVTLAPFTSLSTQLDRLRAQLRWSVSIEPEAPAHGHHSRDPSHTSASTFTRGAAAASEAESGAAAYAKHARSSIPPSRAKIARCTLQTPPHQAVQLLDISSDELELHRMQQQAKRHRTGVPVVNLSSDVTIPITLAKVMGEDVISNDAVSAASSNEEEKLYQYKRCMQNGQISSDDNISEHHFRVNSGALGVDAGTGRGVLSSTVRPLDITGDSAPQHNVGDDYFSSLMWVELPSSMIAFANGRWYGGGMLVAPHANPEDGLLSCTNWVATILPFIAGVRSIYTGRHVYWRSTTAFDGTRFLITSVPPLPTSRVMRGPIDSFVGESSDAGDALYVEADGEVLEAAPAIVELAGKITCLVPQTATVHFGNAAPGTARERLATQRRPREYGSGARYFSIDSGVASPTLGRCFRWLPDGLGRLLRQLANFTLRWSGKGNRKCTFGSSNVVGASV